MTHADEGGWEGVEIEGYRPGAASGIARHTIVGGWKGDPSEPGPALEVRFFDLEPGAASRLERHEHEHYVIVSRGIGHAVVGERVAEIAANDVIYVAPLEIHQFLNRGTEPFGFYCIVTAARDGAQIPNQEEIERLLASPVGPFIRPNAVPPPLRRAELSGA
ncbi:MAG TPA: cupin domain-containing protein [Candidatus Dormibacteraeota bacterium]|nr:cupin domain-containing protein [Candidatus Dormibacteraeota bacterium]